MDVLGRKRGLKFGMLAKQQISLESQKLGRVLNGNSVDFALVPVIVYWGLFNNCYIKREDPDFTFEDVVNFVEDNVVNPDLFTPVLNCLYESSVTSTGTNAEPKDEEKKSTTSTKRKGGTN
jgi:hypothetical protein